ncbi:MAG: hypothetical protein D4S01_08535 [Dehalococcoidia bacterium]|nr:MAG: hypothetical protein D4S01_08535 [Dehalococcoidia bacterium]
MAEANKKSFTVYIGKDGRLTVPKGTRDALGIVDGDLIECTVRKVKRKARAQTVRVLEEKSN